MYKLDKFMMAVFKFFIFFIVVISLSPRFDMIMFVVDVGF